jgi:hypothetical protein
MPAKIRYGGMLNCHIPEQTKKVIEQISEKENASLSEVVRDLLSSGLKNRGLMD